MNLTPEVREKRKYIMSEIGREKRRKVCQRCNEPFFGGSSAKFCIMCKDL